MPVIGTPVQNPQFAGYDQLGPLAAAPDGVTATWPCPGLAPADNFQEMAIWPGVSGELGSAAYVIQAGTWHMTGVAGAVYNFAWLAFVGDPSIPGFNASESVRALPIDALPGQSMTISVVHERDDAAGLGIWRVDYVNNTTGALGHWHFPNPLGAPNPRVQWFGVENPSFGGLGDRSFAPLAHFGTVSMTNCRYTPRGAVPQAMSTLPLQRDVIVPVADVSMFGAPLGVIVSPILSDNASFNCVRDDSVAIP